MNISRINSVQNQYLMNRKYSNIPDETPKSLSMKEIPEEKASSDFTFKGLGDFVGKIFGEHYAKHMMDASWTRSISDWMAKQKGSMTEHMATAGSLITSSVYMGRTLSNKELDNDKKKTLAINQFLCFLIPTACAYWVNHKLSGINKGLERLYSGIQNQKLASGEISSAKVEEILAKKGDRLKGFKTLATLATFTLIYRYVTPVIITPVANLIGKAVNEKNLNKKQV